MTERLQKLLARLGHGSRREIERWIGEGLVTVNGRVAQLGDQAGPDDKVAIRGKVVPLNVAPKTRVIAYHKPDGELTTRKDPEGRPTVFDHLPRLRNGRWIAVGRLDYNTSGLLLLTTDGELAARLMHPSTEVEREYAVRILGEVTPEMLRQLTTGVDLEDGPARFETLRDAGGAGANRWYHVTLREGRNREVRRLWEAVGLTVSRLTRVRYGPVALGRILRAGRWRELEPGEMGALYQAAGLDWRPPKPRPEDRRRPRPPRTARRPKR
jgi:23S rRNA pseudouridine2605 synthase